MEKHKNLFAIFAFLGGVIFSGLIFVSYSTKKVNSKFVLYDKENLELPQRIHPINLDREFDFAGEKVPMNDDTHERLDRELSVNAYWQSTTLLNIKMASKYFPIVDRIFEEQGVPKDFKYLAIAESGYRNLTSPAKAKGYWQFMPGAASDMGLEVNEDIDERYDIEKSTLAAAKYIKQLYRMFGNWTNAAGAYNVGPGGLRNALNKQKEKSYYDVNINEETSRYVFRIIAIKDIVQNPHLYGYNIKEEQMYKLNTNLKTLEVNSTILDLPEFAHQNGTTYRLLKFYNPWLINNKLTVRPGKTYQIKVPN